MCFAFFWQDLLQEVKQLKQKVEELEGERGQYERKLRGTKVLYPASFFQFSFLSLSLLYIYV